MQDDATFIRGQHLTPGYPSTPGGTGQMGLGHPTQGNFKQAFSGTNKMGNKLKRGNCDSLMITRVQTK